MSPTASVANELPKPKGRWWLQPRWLITYLITLLLVTGQMNFDILRTLWVLPVALGSAVAAELLFSWLVRGKVGSIQSAYISGTSTVIMIKAGVLWPYALCALIAVASKYALTYRKHHLWNPTNFAISALLLATSVPVLSVQMGNTPWIVAIVWAVGLVIVMRAGVLHLTLTYLIAFTAFAALRTALTGVPFATEMAPLTGAMYQFFAFFMITDPPTTVSTRKGRITVVCVIAAVECAIRLLSVYPELRPLLAAPPIFALAMVGPIAKWIDLYRTGRAPVAAPAAPIPA
jgi:Na+-translocating ferredoxin:NAD+ oxidoreductase RnfD subunit